jgi:hypothetical protein
MPAFRSIDHHHATAAPPELASPNATGLRIATDGHEVQSGSASELTLRSFTLRGVGADSAE